MPHSIFPEFFAEDQRCHHDELMSAMKRVLQSGRFILGEEGRAFEREYAESLGGGYVVGVASGTDAIELLLRALDIGIGDGVVVPTLAPSAVAAAVRRAGVRLVLCDVEQETLTLCPQAVRECLKCTPGIKAVLAVHLYGHPCDWRFLQKICEEHGAELIEDASQAHGSFLEQKRIGTLGKASVWSFYPTKNLGALGDAGAIWTSEVVLAEKLRCLREYGWRQRHVSETFGINSRLDEIQAAILRVKLPSLVGQVKRRRELASFYLRYLSGVQLPSVREDCAHAFHQFVIRAVHRNALKEHLGLRGIPSMVLYPAALHQQPAFQCAGYFPVAEKAVEEVLSLPLHPYLTEVALKAACEAVEEFYS